MRSWHVLRGCNLQLGCDCAPSLHPYVIQAAVIEKATNSAKLAATAAEERLGHTKGRRLSAANAAAEHATAAAAEAAAEAYARAAEAAYAPSPTRGSGGARAARAAPVG